jgi:hypothetical protein
MAESKTAQTGLSAITLGPMSRFNPNPWGADLVAGVTYPYECEHASPPCRGCESWSQFDPVRGSSRTLPRAVKP